MQQHATLLANNVASCLHGVISYDQTDATTRNIISQQCCVLFARGYTLRANGCNYFQHCGANNVASCLHGVISYEQTDAITSNIVAPTILRPVYTGLYATSKRMQQHATLLANNVASCLQGVIRYEQTNATTRNIISQQCCVLFARGYTLRANECNNTQHY